MSDAPAEPPRDATPDASPDSRPTPPVPPVPGASTGGADSSVNARGADAETAATSGGAPLRIAVLLSGGGTTMVNLADRIAAGTLNVRIEVVIASSDRAAGVQRAQERGLPCHVVPRKAYDDAEAFSEAIFERVRDAEVEFVCLAGFLSLLKIPDDFAQRVINIHPALLPSFGGPGMYGRHVHEAVLKAGCKVSGCTVHFADATYDTGPILVQRCCPVLAGDTAEALAARVFEQECIAYPEALALLADPGLRGAQPSA